MRKTKRIYADYAFFDRTGIQKFLEKQARKGWMLKSTQSGFWKFERIEPRDIHFSVNYFPDAAQPGEEPSQEQLMFIDMCEYAGWNRIETAGSMQIFYHEGENPLPIETDPIIELETIHKATKKEYLSSRWVHLGFGIFYLLLFLLRLSVDPQETLSEYYRLESAIQGLGLTLWSLWEILEYYLWRRKAKRAAELDGSFVDTKSYPYVSWIIILGMLIPMVAMMIADIGIVGYVIILVSVAVVGVSLLCGWLVNMKSEKHKALRLVVLVLLLTVMAAFFAMMFIGALLPVIMEIQRTGALE